MARRLNLKDKMEEINQRFSHKNKAAMANDLLENKLTNISKKMNGFAQKHQAEMNGLRTEASQLLGQLEQNNAVYENEAQAQLQELEELSEFLTARVEGEAAQRREKENQLIQTMERKLRLMKGELEKEKQESTDLIEQITTTLKNDVPSLMNEVIDHSSARQHEEDKLAEIIAEELGNCQALSIEFKDKQEESNSKIYSLIRDLTLKAKREVEEERAVREETHQEILSYIEETCNNLVEN